ncbi:NUDIX hydrolase [Muricauda sp. SCSIO 64092]|uniref:NUDIX hydrolase n=1 Tax=Allomuricauda sp. SCSIO 64092 TaxID=2908842 RepID=UPI001FF24646|nr:NUDIX hydrolase [Muricauda sp. SCSIO 64092]UOY09207.1 NUDIX hydrolase [Muricauda sp. SCSIO 64092]
MDAKEQLDVVKRIKAIAETGLVYAADAYDKERYEELREIGLKLMAYLSQEPFTKLNGFFLPQLDYPTPKVDVRGFVLNESDELLMAQERVDGKWTIPGGWADVGNTPTEVAVKEIREETGLDAEIVRLLAVYDKQRHKHPPEPHYIYKLIFLCRVNGGELKAGFDMQGVGWFSLDNLPPLSEERILENQLRHLFQLVKEDVKEVYSD